MAQMMEEFTTEELDRINLLYGTDFKDITPEDAKLIARFEAFNAKNSEGLQAQLTAIEQEAEEKKQLARETATIAKQNLAELKAAALARLEGIENG